MPTLQYCRKEVETPLAVAIIQAEELGSMSTTVLSTDSNGTLFARNPNDALARSLRVIGKELSLEHDHDAAACAEHGEWGEGLFRDYEAYLDHLSSPADETWPN